MAVRRTLARLFFGALSCCPTTSCLTPPAVLEAKPVLPFERALVHYGPRAEPVELAVAPGRMLRGVFHPADADAPVVLGLLEGTGSIAAERRHYAPLCKQLADLGFATLLVDYGGVGASSGKRSAARLADDARAMWDEAVRRAGGDPARVVLRGISLGTIAAATLLDGGARPGGVVLILPVRPQTVVGAFADEFYGPVVAAFARLAFRDVASVAMEDVIQRLDVPLFVVTGDDDALLDERGRKTLEQAVNDTSGTFLSLPSADHYLTTLEAHALLTAELDFFLDRVVGGRDVGRRIERALASLDDTQRAHVPDGSPERIAFETIAGYALNAKSRHLVAAALARADPVIAMRLRWALEEREAPGVPTHRVEITALTGGRLTAEPIPTSAPPAPMPGLDGLRAFYDLSDPAGPLPIDLVEEAARQIHLTHRLGGVAFLPGTDWIAWAAHTRGNLGRWQSTITTGDLELQIDLDTAELAMALAARGLRGTDIERQIARLLLMAYRIPSRIATTESDSGPALEYFDGDSWHTLEIHHAVRPEYSSINLIARKP